MTDQTPAPRTGDVLTTAEQLDACPVDTVLLLTSGQVFARTEDGEFCWQGVGSPFTYTSVGVVAEHDGQIRVLHVPGETPTRTALESNESAGKLASADRIATSEPVSLVSADGPSLGDALRAQAAHGFTCDPACRCEANIASGRGGNQKSIPPTHVLVQQVARLTRERDGARAQIERVRAVADGWDREGETVGWAEEIRAALAGSELWTTTTLALRLERVRALVPPLAEGGPTDDEPLTVGDIRAALADPQARS